MNFLDNVSIPVAAGVGAASGATSVVYAAATESFGAVATGAALGVVALGWAIWKSLNDNRLNTILDRLDRAEKEVDKYRDEATASDIRAGQLQVKLAVVEARLRLYEPEPQ